MLESGMLGDWIPLMDYAMKKGVSLSTLRRHIKANKVKYRVENGRYLLLLDDDESLTPVAMTSAMTISSASGANAGPQGARDQTVSELQQLVQKMAIDLQRAREEIVELKTLIAFYEDSETTVNTYNV